LTPVRSIAKRRSRAVERTLSLYLVRLALIVAFLAVILVATFPMVKLTHIVATLSRENKVLQTRIFEREQQLSQLQAELILLMSSREVIGPDLFPAPEDPIRHYQRRNFDAPESTQLSLDGFPA